jgi:hypothetical protein
MQNFRTRGRSWLEGVLRQRAHLDRAGLSRGDIARRLDNWERIKVNLDANSLPSDELMARFILRYETEIASLLPGSGSKNARSAWQKYYSITSEAKQIWKNKPLTATSAV